MAEHTNYWQVEREFVDVSVPVKEWNIGVWARINNVDSEKQIASVKVGLSNTPTELTAEELRAVAGICNEAADQLEGK